MKKKKKKKKFDKEGKKVGVIGKKKDVIPFLISERTRILF